MNLVRKHRAVIQFSFSQNRREIPKTNDGAGQWFHFLSVFFYTRFPLLVIPFSLSLSHLISQKNKRRADLDGLSLSLDARLTGLFGPWEVSDWDDEERVAACSVSYPYSASENNKCKGQNVPSISDTSKGVVPSQERGEQTKYTTRLDAADLGNPWLTLTGILELEVTDSEEEEGEIQGEEEQEEGDGGAQGAQQEDGSEDEPAGEVEADGVVEVVLVSVGLADGEATGCQDDGEGDPEAAVGGEGGGTEGVANGHFPGGE